MSNSPFTPRGNALVPKGRAMFVANDPRLLAGAAAFDAALCATSDPAVAVENPHDFFDDYETHYGFHVGAENRRNLCRRCAALWPQAELIAALSALRQGRAPALDADTAEQREAKAQLLAHTPFAGDV